MIIGSTVNENHNDTYRKSGNKNVQAQAQRITQQAVQIRAGGNFSALVGGDLALVASQLKAGDEAYLVAGGKVQLLAEQDYDYSFSEKKKKGSWGSKSLKSDEHTRITHIGSEIRTGGDLLIVSGDEQRYQAAKLNSGADLTLDSGAGIVFEGVKDLEQESHIRSQDNWAWQSAKGKGNTDETLMQSQLQAQGEIAIRAAERIQIDIKEVNQQSVSQTIDAMVQADPQLAWLKDMEQRGDVDWRQVKELHDSFSYSSSGLSGPAAMVIAIVVAYFTAGAASGLVAGAASTAGATTATAGGMWAAGTGASLAGAGWANVAVTSALTGMASNTAIGTINNKGDLGAGLKDATTSDALKGYVVSGVTAGLTAGVYDKWTGTQTGASNTAAASNNTGVLANSGKVAVEGGLSTWSGVGQFAANQALQNVTSATLNKVLGQDGDFGDALTSTLANTFAAAGFNWVGDFSQELKLTEGGLAKVSLHAIMGGLAAEAAGGDFKSGALVAGANEALIDTLAKQYGDMTHEQRSSLLTMNSQVLGVLVASVAGGDEKDMQIGASVAGNATKYNWDLHLPQDMMTYGQAASSLAQHMQEQGASPEELSSALQAMARGDGFSGPDPAKEFLKAWAMTMLSGGGVISTSARGITLIVGGTVGGGSNIVYQISTKELNELNYTDASIATAVGALTQGKGLAGTVGVSMGGAYVGSEIKGTDSTSAVIGAGVGAVSGAGVGKIWSNKASTVMPEKVVEILGMTAGAVTSEITSDTSEAILKSKENR